MRVLGIVTLCCFLPFFVSAQGLGGAFFDTGPSLTLNPSTPGPNQSFTASVEDYTGAEITWTYNGLVVEAGTNKRSVTLMAGDVGSTGTLSVALGGQTVSTTITPVYLDIIVEPQTHVPTFFKGRPLASAGSGVRATALINGSYSADYIYTWRVNNTAIGGGPERGRFQTSFTMPQDSEVTLSLTVTTLAGKLVARRGVSIPSVQPRLLFYEVNTLYGISHRAIENSFALISNSATIQAEPYYLSSTVFNAPSRAEWSINGDEVLTGEANPYRITLERTGASGEANISFRVLSTTVLLQQAKRSFQISL